MGKGSIISGLLSPLRYKDKKKENLLYTVFEDDDEYLALDSTYEVFDWNEGQFKSKSIRNEYKGLRITSLCIIKLVLFVIFSLLTFEASKAGSSNKYKALWKILTAFTGASALVDFSKLLIISFINLQYYRKKSANYKVGRIKRRIVDHYIYVRREIKIFIFCFGFFIIFWQNIEINTMINGFKNFLSTGTFSIKAEFELTPKNVAAANVVAQIFIRKSSKKAALKAEINASGIIEFFRTIYEKDHLSNIVMICSIFSLTFLLKKIFINLTAANFHQGSIGSRIKSNRVCRKITQHLCLKHLSYDENQIINEALERKDLSIDSSILSVIINTISDGLFKLLSEEDVDGDGSNGALIYEKSLMKYLSHTEADQYFHSMDIDSIGNVSRQQFYNFIHSLWVEKDALINSTKSQNEVIKKYDTLLLSVTYCCALASCMSWLEKDVKHKEFTASLGGIFFFIYYLSDDILLRAFNSILFIVYTHPFDSGDSIKIFDGNVWERMVVKEVGLWACKFTGTQNQYIMIPNYQLRDKMIINIRRSPNQYESLTISIQANTPLDKIRKLESRLLDWVGENYEEFQPELFIEGFELKNRTEMEVSINVAHRGNFHDYSLQSARTQKFYFYLRDLLEELGIELGSIE